MGRSSNKPTGAGSRSRQIRGDRIRAYARKRKGFVTEEDFVAHAGVLARPTLGKAWRGEDLRESSLKRVADYLGVDDYRIFLRTDPLPERSQTFIEYGICQMIVRQIAGTEISAIQTNSAGEPCPTNLFTECKRLSGHEKIRRWACDDETARRVCQRLERDMMAIRVSDEVYHVRCMPPECLDQIIEHRVESELIQHKKRIQQLQHDPTEAMDLRKILKSRLELCRKQQGNGIQFRLNDAEFHSEIALSPEIGLSIRGLVEMCDQPYMKMRLLLKNLFHESSEEYSRRIRAFNELQLSDLEDIVEEYLRKKPRLMQLRQILFRHAGRQRQAFAECDTLLQTIKDKGDPYGFADYCRLGANEL